MGTPSESNPIVTGKQTQWAIEVTAIEKAEDGIFDVDYREVSDPSEGHYLVLEADECVHVLTRN